MNTCCTDPVCGSLIDPGAAECAAEYEGVAYYFCSAGCQSRYLRELSQWADVYFEPMDDEGRVIRIFARPLRPGHASSPRVARVD